MALLHASNVSILAAALVVILPGLALSIWTRGEDDRLDILELLAESFGLSICLAALMALWFFLTGIVLTSNEMVAIYLASGAAVLTGIARRRIVLPAILPTVKGDRLRERQGEESDLQRAKQKIHKVVFRFLLPLIFFLALITWRFYQARELYLPAWVDSLHHVLLVRIILEGGGLVESLDPYLPVSHYYHFGFHVFGAVFSFWSGLPPERAVLVAGQILNASIALSIYRLGKTLWEGVYGAGLALILAGFVSQMPAYYLTWGRYTLLAGLLILPLAMAEGVNMARSQNSAGSYLRFVLYCAGLILTHYFAAFLLAVFLVFLSLETLLVDLRKQLRFHQMRWARPILAASGGFILTIPWFLRVWDNIQGRLRVDALLDSEAVETLYFSQYPLYLWRLSGPTHNYLLLFLASLGIVAALRRPWSRSLGLWALALAALSVPWGLRISHFRPDHFVIVLFVPATLLAAGLITTGWRKTVFSQRRYSGMLRGILVLMFAGFTLWGILETRSVINPATILANQGDTKALDWVSENISEEAKFFINVIHWQYGSYRGVDGGWWILPITGRQTLLPPVLYFMGEREYVSKISARARIASSIEECSREFWALVEEAGLTHVYLREGVGSLQPDNLGDCEGLNLVYAGEGVAIYEIADEQEKANHR